MSAQWGTWARNLSLEVSEWLNISQKVMQTWSREWTLYMLSQSLIKAHLSEVHQVATVRIFLQSWFSLWLISFPLPSDKCAFIRDWEGVCLYSRVLCWVWAWRPAWLIFLGGKCPITREESILFVQVWHKSTSHTLDLRNMLEGFH